jgi:hypothetical protein
MITDISSTIISSPADYMQTSRLTLDTYTFTFSLCPAILLLQWVLGQVLGDPLHRERCIWVGDDGNHCQNTVPLDSRINGALCFQLLQSPLLVYSLVQRFSSAAKQLLCFECRRHRCRAKVWATRFLHLLDQAKDVTVQPHLT